MEFAKQIKQLRAANQLTQEQLARQLNVSRQTISSWETGRNLPDLEMVVVLAKLFEISLDTLILGDDKMENKLIDDGNLVNKSRNNRVSLSLIVIGVICFLIKALIKTKVLADGTLSEPFFFLLPIGYLFIFLGLLIGIISLIKVVIKKL